MSSFIYNATLAMALAQLLPAEERKIIRLWLDRLSNIKDDSELMTRDDYMLYLLMAIRNRRVTLPFNRRPYVGPLKPIHDIVPSQVYHEVVTYDEGEANLAWIEQVMKHGKEITKDAAPESPPSPSQFLKNQPIPESGIICYMGAFSDQTEI